MPSHPEFPELGLVLAGGGGGTRFGGERNKLLLAWHGVALFCHPLRTFLPLLNPAHIVVTAPVALLETFRQAMCDADLPVEQIQLVPGGATRLASVANALAALPPAVRLVAVQDGARPLSSADLLRRCAKSARGCGSGVAGRPVTDTIKMVDPTGRVLETPDRSTLWAAETPQLFRRDWLEEGVRYAQERGVSATDDAQAVELAGYPVQLVRSEAPNPKVTWPGDLERLG